MHVMPQALHKWCTMIALIKKEEHKEKSVKRKFSGDA
jgi:hypothetical protein